MYRGNLTLGTFAQSEFVLPGNASARPAADYNFRDCVDCALHRMEFQSTIGLLCLFTTIHKHRPFIYYNSYNTWRSLNGANFEGPDSLCTYYNYYYGFGLAGWTKKAKLPFSFVLAVNDFERCSVLSTRSSWNHVFIS